MNDISPEALLRQDDWMRRVARALTSDSHAAEDAVQETWIADLRGGSAARDRGAWLRGVLRNRSARRARQDRVVRERAEDAGREVGAPAARAADDAAAARELRRLVAERVLALETPLRDTVHLTYFAGLSTREVAARTGVSPTAVRKRLEKALATLRRELDAEHGGDRRRWSVALGPFLYGRESAVGASNAVTWLPILALSVVAALVGAFLLLRGGGARVEPGELISRADVESVVPAAPGAFEAPSRSAVPAPSPLPAAQSTDEAVIRVRVQNLDGTPAGGAVWRLHGRVSSVDRLELYGRPDTWVDPTGVADADGRIEVRLEPPGAYRFELAVDVAGRATEVWRWSDLRPGTEVELGLCTLRPEARLRVHVENADGTPHTESAWVAGVSEEWKSTGGSNAPTRRGATFDAGESSGVVDGLAGGRARVNVRHAALAWTAQEVEVELVAGETRDVRIAVPAPSPEGGDGTSQTPGGGAVVLSPYASMDPGVVLFDPSDVFAFAADGSALDVVVEGDATYPTMRILAPGGGPVSAVVDDVRFERWVADDLTPGTHRRIELVGAGRVRFRSADGAVAEVSRVRVVSMRRGDGMQGSGYRWLDVEDGVFGGLVPGVSYVLELDTPAGKARAVVPLVVAGAVTDVEVAPALERSVSGTVRFPDGAPAAHVDVVIVRPAAQDDGPSSWVLPEGGAGYGPEVYRTMVAKGRTDAGGAYALRVRESGPYVVYAAGSSGIEVQTGCVVEEGDVGGVDLLLPRGGSVHGRIAPDSAFDPRDWRVHVSTEDGTGSQLDAVLPLRDLPGRLDDEGRFAIDGLPVGSIHVWLVRAKARGRSSGGTRPLGRAPSLSPRIATVDVEEGGRVELDFVGAEVVPPLLTVELTGLDGVAGGRRIRAVSRTPSARGTRAPMARSKSDRLGPLVLDGRARSLQVSGEGWALAAVPFDPNPHEATVLTIDAVLEWREVVVLRGGAPLVSGAVDVRVGIDGAVVRVTTDGAGRARIGLPSGEAWFRPAAGRVVPYAEVWDPEGVRAVQWPVAEGTGVELP